MGADADHHFIERLTWDEVAQRIADGAIVILPIGAAAKEHGFHLPLNTDRLQAEWFAANLAERFNALVWPTVTYGYYPAFTEYAGSSSLQASTFENVVHEIATRILAKDGRKLLVLDTGISTRAPIERAIVALEGVLHLQIHSGPRYRRAAETVAEQGHGSHADELETSLMLALAPHLVDMARAEASPALKQPASGPLTPTDKTSPNYSRSGSYGDPTLATPAKGKILLAAILDDLNEQVTAFMTETSAAAPRSNPAESVAR